MDTVVVDTNALMMPVESDVRLFDELDRLLGGYDAVVPRAVLEELASLSDGGGPEGAAASVGHDLATERCRAVESGEQYADDAVVDLARSGGADYVVTNDGPLKARVLDAGVPVIALRAKNKLAVTQP